MWINLKFGVPSCGQFSLTAAYAQIKDVDNRWVAVEQTGAQKYPRAGELDSNPPGDASGRSRCRPLSFVDAAGAELGGQ
jgi:hypothetical protein